MLRFLLTLLSAIALFASLPQRASGQAAVNVASYANPNLPNGSLAQGGMFTVFGTNLGPATLVEAGPKGFPLPTTLEGASISVTVGGTTVDCIMIFTSAGQVAGILPSNTPTGEGAMTVTYNGTATAPFDITVVPHSFGISAINTQGSGPGVFTNANNPRMVNTITASAAAGEMWDIWGTGLAAAPFPDNQAPIVQDLRQGFNVQVVIGGKQAEVIYAGRSGCCSGVDQIRFVVPSELSGCYVPVYLVVDGVPSNSTSMSIGPSGGACSDAGGLSSEALSDNELTMGFIGLTKTIVDFDIPGVGQATSQRTEYASASYFGYTVDQAVRQGFNGTVFNVGSCTVYQFSGDQADYEDPVAPAGLDAGAETTISGPPGSRTLARQEIGQYGVMLSSPVLGPAARKAFTKALGLNAIRALSGGGPEQNTSEFFTNGTYTYAAPGGADVEAHSKDITIGNPLSWTNKNQITAVTRSQGQTLTWTPYSGEAMISGSSFTLVNDEDAFGAGFFCLADGSAGTFTVPAAVLQAMPPSAVFSGGGFSIETGALSIGLSLREECSATGLDVCSVSYVDSSSKVVGYR